MADVLRLADRDQTFIVDLLSGTYTLVEDSWTTLTAPPNSEFTPVQFGAHPEFSDFAPQIEIMDLAARTTGATIRGAERDIYRVLEGARMFNQKPLWTAFATGGGVFSPRSYWLEWNIDGEPARRALIYDGSFIASSQCPASPMTERGASKLQLSLTRHPFWEDTTTSLEYHTIISTWGGTAQHVNITGDVPARMRYAWFSGRTITNLTQGWWGIREKMAGYANFNPVWECEDGSVYNAAAAMGGDALASPDGAGDSVRKVGPASTLTRYWSMTVEQQCTAGSHTNYEHYFGEYLVLCRCRVDIGEVGLQMRYGFYGNLPSLELTIAGEEVIIDNTNYMLVELGQIQIPPTGVDEYLNEEYARYTMIEVWAEQITSVSQLYLDAICLIPTHHFMYVNNADIRATGGGVHYRAAATTTENDKQTVYGMHDDAASIGLEYSLENWYLPKGDSLSVVAAQDSVYGEIHALDNSVNLRIQYYPRWAMYAETGGT